MDDSSDDKLLSAELMLVRHEALTLHSLDLVLDDRPGGVAIDLKVSA